MSVMRVDGRIENQLRPVTITAGVHPYAEGSAEVSFGSTRLLVTASVEQSRPRWMSEGEGGWITAEYGMLPRSTHTRSGREAASGKQGGRTLEIQRLIGRALRAATDLGQLENLTIRLDCDVLIADGGTRTAAISGGWVALMQALNWIEARGLVASPVARHPIAAVSLGAVQGSLLLDLCYEEDSSADYDVNVVMNGNFDLIELQGTAERAPIPQARLTQLLEVAAGGCREIFALQQQALQKVATQAVDSK
jgi:ribonuclease PH